jgi:hypothetical protein
MGLLVIRSVKQVHRTSHNGHRTVQIWLGLCTPLVPHFKPIIENRVEYRLTLFTLFAMRESSTSLNHIDRLGASASFICAVHCMIMPFAVTILPLFGIGFLADDRVEHVVLFISIALAVTSVCYGFRIHRKPGVPILFGAALFLILMGRNAPEGPLEIALVVPGALLFVCGHFLNHRFCRMCSVCASSTSAGILDCSSKRSE